MRQLGANTPDPHVPQTGVDKSPFQISSNRLEVDENVTRAHFRTYWLVVMWCNNNCTAVVKAQNVWTQIKHNMCGSRAAKSPLCDDFVLKTHYAPKLHHVPKRRTLANLVCSLFIVQTNSFHGQHICNKENCSERIATVRMMSQN